MEATLFPGKESFFSLRPTFTVTPPQFKTLQLPRFMPTRQEIMPCSQSQLCIAPAGQPTSCCLAKQKPGHCHSWALLVSSSVRTPVCVPLFYLLRSFIRFIGALLLRQKDLCLSCRHWWLGNNWFRWWVVHPLVSMGRIFPLACWIED